MKRDFSHLQNLHVEEPCSADWDAMSGEERSRFCASCQKEVFNLEDLTRSEAADLFEAHPTGLCVRFQKDERDRVVYRAHPVVRTAANLWKGFAILLSLGGPLAARAQAPMCGKGYAAHPPGRTMGALMPIRLQSFRAKKAQGHRSHSRKTGAKSKKV